MRIAFLGTPEFAVPSLDALYKEGFEIAVFTAPDKPVGRHAVLTPPPVKARALELGLPVYQFERIRRSAGLAALREFAPDFMVTAAFGQLLSQANLDIPKYGTVNVHGSLLPKYRGASPIQSAVIAGERLTGITTMLTDLGMDTGAMLLKAETEIGENETAGELSARLSFIGAELLIETLQLLRDGSLQSTPQDNDTATLCRPLQKEDGKLHFARPAREVHNRVRGVTPWPGAYALLDGLTLKIWATRCVNIPEAGQPGLLKGDPKIGLFVQCADALLEITELQAQGGRRMDAKSFLRGRPIAGNVLE
ncbi:MAG: methionyl-tRNA formyltransferase [Clostridiales bacterium]|nr:methionyl-tRNA formyltransferase [Clostridiales bacterium]